MEVGKVKKRKKSCLANDKAVESCGAACAMLTSAPCLSSHVRVDEGIHRALSSGYAPKTTTIGWRRLCPLQEPCFENWVM